MSRNNISPLIKAQLEKLTLSGSDLNYGRRPVNSSTAIIIPKKPARLNPSSYGSSSYTSTADFMPSSNEEPLESHQDINDVSTNLLSTLSSNCQKLEHSAARDRIKVKNKRRHTTQFKLNTLKENDHSQTNTFMSDSDDETDIYSLKKESKLQSKSVINLSDYEKTYDSSSKSIVRHRDHSADSILSTKSPLTPAYSSINSQEINQTKSFFTTEDDKVDHRYKSLFDDTNANNSCSTQSITYSSSQEHIYDNSDLFLGYKANRTSDSVLNDIDPSTNRIVETRERPAFTMNHSRPVTICTPTTNYDGRSTAEFENDFNFKQKSISIQHLQYKPEATLMTPLDQPIQSVEKEQMPSSLSTAENESIVPIFISTYRIDEISSVNQSPSRQKKNVDEFSSNKNRISVMNSQATPTWIDIAKQKQSKIQSVLFEKYNCDNADCPKPLAIQPTALHKKQVIQPSDAKPTVQETHSNDVTFRPIPNTESTIVRRPSPQVLPINTNAIERDSIRAIRTNNHNRINNLIQFFDK